MKKILFLTLTLVTFGLAPAFAQFGPRGGAQGPHFGGALDQLFGEHKTFSAVMEFQTSGQSGENVILPGKLSFDGGKSRFEMNLSEAQGTKMPASALAQMKAMGMDSIITITRPDLKLTYLVYPGLNSYAAMPQSDSSAGADAADFKVETAELGKETVAGHDCVKNKVTVTDKDGAKHESTVWNATDLKNFPVKIVTGEQGQNATMRFKNISFDQPAASLFETPAGFTKYDNVQTMMQTEMMKHLGGAMGQQ
jgi:hypothetical protein